MLHASTLRLDRTDPLLYSVITANVAAMHSIQAAIDHLPCVLPRTIRFESSFGGTEEQRNDPREIPVHTDRLRRGCVVVGVPERIHRRRLHK